MRFKAPTVDRILHGGRIWTADPLNPWATALAIGGNTIVAVGDDHKIKTLAGPNTELQSLDGKLVLPGLWDAHMHFYYWCLSLRQTSLVGCLSLGEMMDRVKESLDHPADNAWLTGWGWNETQWPDGRAPTRHDLDPITGDRPALFYRSDMHCAVANTAALKLGGLLEFQGEVEGGLVLRDADGLPTGLLLDQAINPIRQNIPAPTLAFRDEAMKEGLAELHRLGITGFCDQRMKDQDDGPRALTGLTRLNRRKELRHRVSCNVAAHNLALLEALGLSANLGDENFRLGHVKIFLDGTMGSRSARMLEPYPPIEGETDENSGFWLTDPDQALEEALRAVDLGFAVSIHAIGDEANRVAIDLLEHLRSASAEAPGLPHSIEHVQILDPEDLPRVAQVGATANVQPGHILDDMNTAEAVLGSRANRVYRYASLAASGARLAMGSDAPVSEINPFYGMQGAVLRRRPNADTDGPWYKEECLTLDQVLRAYTLGGAQALGYDRLTGSLEPGKRADLIVLDRDLFKLVEDAPRDLDLTQTRVLQTFFDGELVYQHSS